MISRQHLIFIGIFSLIGVVSGLIITRQVNLNRPTAGLKIDTEPISTVYIDNQQIGSTPLDKKLPPGEILVKLIPDAASLSGQSFQTKIRLTDRVYTLINRDFGGSDISSAGESIMLLPLSGKSTSLSIISDPDSASVIIDSEPQGFTPLSLDSINPGDHQIDISAPGYKPRTINVKAVSGYKLQLIVKLAVTGSPVAVPPPVGTTPKPSPAVSPGPTGTPGLQPPYVKILDTPTGYLRVRSTPSTGASEVGKLNPGDKLPFLEEKSGWYRIRLENQTSSTSSGWISAQYAQLVK